jgi:hypothetical protein
MAKIYLRWECLLGGVQDVRESFFSTFVRVCGQKRDLWANPPNKSWQVWSIRFIEKGTFCGIKHYLLRRKLNGNSISNLPRNASAFQNTFIWAPIEHIQLKSAANLWETL